MNDICPECGKTLNHDEDHDKYDPEAIVYGDDFAYHLGCEDEVYEEVYASVEGYPVENPESETDG